MLGAVHTAHFVISWSAACNTGRVRDYTPRVTLAVCNTGRVRGHTPRVTLAVSATTRRV